MSLSNKLVCKGTLRQVFICMRPPPLQGFCLGWSIKFVGSESGQSVKLPQNMVSNRSLHPHPLPTTHCLYILYFDTGEGGELNQRAGATVHKAESKMETFTKIDIFELFSIQLS